MRAIWAISNRTLLRTLRRPQTALPLVIVPTMFLATTSGGVAQSVNLPGFPPVESFFQFALAGSIMQSTMLAGLTTGIAVAMDIESGFFDRMVAAPIARTTLVTGRLISAVVIAMIQATFFLTIGVVFGAAIDGGIIGIAAIWMLAALTATGIGGLAIALALKTRSTSVVQGMFPLVFVGIFLSSTFFPRALLIGPAKTIADLNPLSYIAEGIRGSIITDVSWHTFLPAIASGVSLCLVTCGLSVWVLRRRIGDV